MTLSIGDSLEWIIRVSVPMGALFSYRGPNIQDYRLLLQRQVFSHGQLYMVVSRAKTINGLKVLCCDKDGEYTNSTSNVVYNEVLIRI